MKVVDESQRKTIAAIVRCRHCKCLLETFVSDATRTIHDGVATVHVMICIGCRHEIRIDVRRFAGVG